MRPYAASTLRYEAATNESGNPELLASWLFENGQYGIWYRIANGDHAKVLLCFFHQSVQSVIGRYGKAVV